LCNSSSNLVRAFAERRREKTKVRRGKRRGERKNYTSLPSTLLSILCGLLNLLSLSTARVNPKYIGVRYIVALVISFNRIKKLRFYVKTHRLVITFAIILVALNVLDVLTTTAALRMGCKESNGFAIFLFATFGSTFGIIIKLGAATMVGYSAIYSYHLDCEALRSIVTMSLIGMVCLYAAVVYNNINTIFSAAMICP
jgi:hypothetical protein